MSADPWDTIEDRFPPGQAITGVVTKTKKYGAFLQIADGVEGLLHISELSWDHVERTEDVLKVGDEVTVMVLNADKVRRRISLSLRQLQSRGPDAGGEEFYPGADYEPEAEDGGAAGVRDEAPEPAAVPDVVASSETTDAVEAPDVVASADATEAGEAATAPDVVASADGVEAPEVLAGADNSHKAEALDVVASAGKSDKEGATTEAPADEPDAGEVTAAERERVAAAEDEAES
jgi:hypothetical protein